MEKSFSDSYKAAGVDVTAGYKAVELMKAHVARTQTAGSLSGIGGFGGLFELDRSCLVIYFAMGWTMGHTPRNI